MTNPPLLARQAARTRQALILFIACCFMLAGLASISILQARADGGGVPTDTPLPTFTPTVTIIITPPPAIVEVTVVIPAQGEAVQSAQDQRADQQGNQGLLPGQATAVPQSGGSSPLMCAVPAIVGVVGLVIVVNFLVRKLRSGSPQT